MLTNFVTLLTPPRNAFSHLPTLQASTEYFDSCGHFSDPNSINMQSRGFVISWTKRKTTMPINTKCRTPSVTSPKCSYPWLVRTSDGRHSVYHHVQRSISFYYEDQFVTTCNVTFYITSKLKQTFLFPNVL